MTGHYRYILYFALLPALGIHLGVENGCRGGCRMTIGVKFELGKLWELTCGEF